MTQYRYLTFDCYGTLVDWRTGLERAFESSFGRLPISGGDLYRAYIAEEASQENSYKRYRSILAETSVRVAMRLGVTAGDREGWNFADSLPSWPPFADTVDSLKKMGEMGYKRYILSNVDEDLLKETFARNDLEVDGYVTAEETHSYKPAPGHWESFMSRTGATISDNLHVAQSIFHDIRPAQGLGFATAWVNRYDESLAPDVHPDYICRTLSDLVSILH